jgi:peptidyl-prolyl cis-trans isomerase C
MLKYLAPLSFSLALSCALITLPASAQEVKTIVTIGGEAITEKDVEVAQKALGPQFGRMAPEQRRLAAIAALIDIKAIALKAKQAQFDQSEEFKKELTFITDRTLHDAFFEKEIVGKITDKEVQARYDKEIAAMPPLNEVRARHILVKTEAEAQEIIKKLEGGAKFEDLAKEKSSDSSAKEGGDLGFFGPGQMVPEFEKQAFTLKKGEYTKQPVKTQFGFHVIKVEETRVKPAPKFEDVMPQVRAVVLREKYVDLARQLRDELKLEWVDTKIKQELDKAQKPQASQQPKP